MRNPLDARHGSPCVSAVVSRPTLYSNSLSMPLHWGGRSLELFLVVSDKHQNIDYVSKPLIFTPIQELLRGTKLKEPESEVLIL